MKTQIIQLVAHDDVLSTRDKMGWSQTSRILLVWPKRGRILNRRVDLVLLQRYSTQLGAHLALVTRDSHVRFYARDLGIPTFISLQKARSSLWRTRRLHPAFLRRSQPRPDFETLRSKTHAQTPAWMEHIAARLTFFSLGMLAVLAILAALLPVAEIHLRPQRYTQQLELPLRASPAVQTPNLAGELPAYRLTIVVEGRDWITPTGTILWPQTPAVGNVIMTNLTDQEVTIPQETIVSTLGSQVMRFATQQEARLAAGPGKTVLVPVRALLPGKVGNLPADSLLAIEGALGLKLSARNPSPTRGGSDQPAPGPTPEDRQQLYDRLCSQLEETAQLELTSLAEAGPGELGRQAPEIPILASLALNQVLEEKYEPAGDLPANQLFLTLRLEFQALSIRETDLLSLLNPVMDANLLDGFQSIPGSLTYEQVTPFEMDFEKSTVHWSLLARRAMQPLISTDLAANLLRGREVKQAGVNLAEWLDLAEPAQVSVTPRWWPYLPLLPFRMKVTILENSHQETSTP